MEKPFIIYRSSAGSGKTYTLALEYLKLALRQGGAYRAILAVTFTNKATREMKSRILLFLYQLSQGTNPSLAEQLTPALGVSGEALQARARETLSHMLHGYSWFAVMTIDAFFQKVIRAFARELGLQAGFVLELDQEKVLDEVVDQLISEISDQQHQQLREWMIRFAEEKVEAGKVWDFRKDIKQLARELFKEDYKVRQEVSLNTHTEDADKYANILKELKAIVAKFENAMRSFGERGLSHMQKHGLEFTDFAYGKSGVGNYFMRVLEGSDYEPKKRAEEAARDPEKWSTKKSPKKDKIAEAVESGLQSILQQAIAYYQKEHINYQSARQLLKFIYAYGILQDIQHKLDAYKRENDVMLISDAAVFLRNIIGRDDTPFVYEKIGSSFQHFLIDEFQDTSGLQWANFRPLVENSLDSGFRNLVVGDVKQSIYRWRGGDWQLLLEKIEQDIPEWNTEVRQLDRNFRSLPDVIHFNNSLFEHLPRAVYHEMVDRIAEVEDVSIQQVLLERAAIVQHAYDEARQKFPNHSSDNDWQGYVELNLLSREERDEEDEVIGWKAQVKARIPALVEALQDRGYQLRDIAFLVRDKKAGKEIVDTLMQYQYEGHAREGYRYDFISSESLFLNASLAVGLLVDVLRFLDNPQDALAKGSIAYKYRKLQGKEMGSDELHRIFSTAAESVEDAKPVFFQYMPEGFEDIYSYLNKLPLYELVENLIALFQLNRGEELAYLQAFQDAVLQYSGQQSGDLHTFLKWWEDKGQETSVQVSEELDAMRILTIHKAKGLQFKVVLIPFCDWELDHRPGLDNIIWTEAEQAPFASFGLMPMRYSRQLSATVFSRDYYEEMIKAYIDNINLLYVAFTRAEECLYAYAAPKISKRGECKLNSIANGLYQLCAADEHPAAIAGNWDEESRTFSLGSPPPLREKVSSQAQANGISYYPSERWRNRISVRPLARSFFSMDEQGSMQVNQAVLRRDVLARLRDSNQLDQRLEQVYHERGLNREDMRKVKQLLQSALQQKPLADWFAPDTKSQVSSRLVGREGRLYNPDRIVWQGEQLVIIQFHEDAADKRNWQQLQSAAAVLREMGHTVEAYVWDTQKMQARALKATAAAGSQSAPAR
jgi:ATP-dependent exoDNAse (exonuclease V) beta subunit